MSHATSYPADHPRRTIIPDLLRSLRPVIVERGLADDAELANLDREVREHLADPRTVIDAAPDVRCVKPQAGRPPERIRAFAAEVSASDRPRHRLAAAAWSGSLAASAAAIFRNEAARAKVSPTVWPAS
jgi:hypothetical protein